MEIELQYKKAIAEHKLKESDLPEDAQTGIAGIGEVLRAITMLEKKGKAPRPATLKKLKAMDKWVYYEILDHLNDTEKNEKVIPVTAEEVVAEVKAEGEQKPPVVKKEEVIPVVVAEEIKPEGEEVKLTPEQKKGFEIEAELLKMIESGRAEWDIESVKGIAPKTYAVLFETYEEGKENGVKTSKYSILETKPKVFTINAN